MNFNRIPIRAASNDDELFTEYIKIENKLEDIIEAITNSSENTLDSLNQDVLNLSSKLSTFQESTSKIIQDSENDIDYNNIEDVPGFLQMADDDPRIEYGYDIWDKYVTCLSCFYDLGRCLARLQDKLTSINEMINLEKATFDAALDQFD